jgi:O-antigen/teichoic acid export membrane protein
VTVSKALNTLALQADYVLVGRMLGVEALGIYNRSYQLMLIPVNLVGQAVSAVLLPSLSKVQGEPAKLREAYLTTTAMMAVLGNVAAVLFVVLAPEIVMLVLGPQWGRAVAPFQLLSFVLTLRIAYKLDDTLAKAVAAIRARMVRDALYATAVIVGVAFGVRWGVSGAAAAIAGAITMNFVLGVALSLTVTGATTGAYLAAHRSGAALGAMALITAAGARYAALHWWSSDAVVLGAVTLAVAVVLVVGVLAVPTLLTPRLRHFVDAVLALAPQIRIVRVVRRRVAPARQLPGTVPPRRPDADR